MYNVLLFCFIKATLHENVPKSQIFAWNQMRYIRVDFYAVKIFLNFFEFVGHMRLN